LRAAADHWHVAIPAACMLISAAVAGCAGAQAPAGETLTARVTERAQLRAAPAGRVVAAVGRFTEYGGRRVYRVVRRDGDWLAILAPERPNGRTGWIKAEHVVLASTRWRITVDRSARRLTLRRSGELARRMLVTVGAPSSPTPLGRFAITDKLRMESGSVYGCCALALSGSQTRGRLAGVRLAIHGTRVPERLGRAASNGCARATARDLRRLMRTVPLGTPVTVVR
jgi:lipoprotein-anchoring transpeptidase ErfK/SrfK